MKGKHVTIEELNKIAGKRTKNNLPWHHHCLHNKCIFNDTNKDLVLLEADKIYYAFVKNDDIKYKRNLERMAYNMNKKRKIKTEKKLDNNVLKKIITLDKNKRWHFHILLPHCIFNNSKKYKLIIENETDEKKEEFLFDRHPWELVKEIDKIYLK